MCRRCSRHWELSKDSPWLTIPKLKDRWRTLMDSWKCSYVCSVITERKNKWTYYIWPNLHGIIIIIHHLIQGAKKLVHVKAVFLGRQVAPQRTKPNPWNFNIRWPSILPSYCPNSIDSPFVPHFTETLQPSRLNEPVFLLTPNFAQST